MIFILENVEGNHLQSLLELGFLSIKVFTLYNQMVLSYFHLFQNSWHLIARLHLLDFYIFQGFIIIKLYEQVKKKSFPPHPYQFLPWLLKLLFFNSRNRPKIVRLLIVTISMGNLTSKKLVFPIKNNFPSYCFLKKQFSETTDPFQQTESHYVNVMSKFYVYYISTSFRLARHSNQALQNSGDLQTC